MDSITSEPWKHDFLKNPVKKPSQLLQIDVHFSLPSLTDGRHYFFFPTLGANEWKAVVNGWQVYGRLICTWWDVVTE